MGRAGPRRSEAVRVFDSRRRAGRIELDDDFAEAEELSEGVRWLSRGKSCALWRARGEAAAPGRWNRAQPFENRSHDTERTKTSGGAERTWDIRSLFVAFCRRQTNSELLAPHFGCARAHSRIGRHEPRFGEARVQIRRINHLLCADA